MDEGFNVLVMPLYQSISSSAALQCKALLRYESKFYCLRKSQFQNKSNDRKFT